MKKVVLIITTMFCVSFINAQNNLQLDTISKNKNIQSDSAMIQSREATNSKKEVVKNKDASNNQLLNKEQKAIEERKKSLTKLESREK